MPGFRILEPARTESIGPLSPEQVQRLLEDVLRPSNFFVAPTLALEWQLAATEEVAWEVFKGRLLDPAHTRVRRQFESWSVYRLDYGQHTAEPLLSLRLDAEAGAVHITRAIYYYAWEGYDAGGNVFQSRETRKWGRELVGTVPLNRFPTKELLRDELIARIFQAVVGTSRLPLTSVEAPLPEFSLGQLAYVYCRGTDGGPMTSPRELLQGLDASLAWIEKVKLLEAYLRAVSAADLSAATEQFASRWGDTGHSMQEVLTLLRGLFNEAALSPYTDFVDKALGFVDALAAQGHATVEDAIDFLGALLRQIIRHLTAYDLVTFHHRGANYPDALLLDAALKRYLRHVEEGVDSFLDFSGDDPAEARRKRLRRRALRQGWLVRRRYEGHPVPDQPTSPGENLRILPPPFDRIPEEQILDPSKRTKRLYAGDPLPDHLTERSRAVLRLSIEDLSHPHELRELGMAVFLDRPLGGGKLPGEPDQTPLISYEAFSRSIAERRLSDLANEPAAALGPDREAALRQTLGESLVVRGIPLHRIGAVSRPGAVSLADARKAAGDFVFLRTTASSVEEFRRQFSFGPLVQRFPLDDLMNDRRWLIVRESTRLPKPEVRLAVYDVQLRKRLELVADLSRGYECRGGLEYPADGLRVVRVWAETGPAGSLQELDLQGEPVLLPPR